MEHSFTLIEENYLKALFHLQNEAGEVGVNELSKALDVKMPSVNSMIKKLAEKDLVIYESYKPVILTEEGRNAAALIIRKHRLTEMFLVEQMGFAWDEVHEIAEQMEHIKSPIFFKKMDELLNYPQFDPHGSPIPCEDGSMPQIDGILLKEANIGKVYTLKGLQSSEDVFLKYLDEKNIQLNVSLEVLSINDYDGSYDLRVNGDFEVNLTARAGDCLILSE